MKWSGWSPRTNPSRAVVCTQLQQSDRDSLRRCHRGALGGDEDRGAGLSPLWDNAYAVHHLTDEAIEIANILDLSARHGNPNRAFVFASTSKITLSGSGLALFAASKDDVKWLLARLTPRTIGPDKINQLRHVRFLKNPAGVPQLMNQHKALIAPKFEKVLEIFDHSWRMFLA